MPKKLMMITAAGLALTAAQANAQDYYLAGNIGLVQMGDSSNSGDLTQDFVLGLGAGTLTDQAAYVFDTDFEVGVFSSIAIGKTTAYGPFRSELEFSFTRNDVRDHDDLQALGGSLQDADIAVLTGGMTPAGLTVGRAFEDAQGSVKTYGFMVNGYYDFAVSSPNVHPYVGVGIGALNTKVHYNPSRLGVADDSATTFGYQLMAGVDFDTSARTVLHAGFRYRGSQPVEVEADAIPSDLEVDINQFVAEIGYRWKF